MRNLVLVATILIAILLANETSARLTRAMRGVKGTTRKRRKAPCLHRSIKHGAMRWIAPQSLEVNSRRPYLQAPVPPPERKENLKEIKANLNVLLAIP